MIVNLPEQALRITDVVAEVERLTGEKEIIIIHVEVEARRKKPLPRRMFVQRSVFGTGRPGSGRINSLDETGG